VNIYEGTGVKVTLTFTNPTGALTDPTTVTVKVKNGATVTTYAYGTGQITRVSSGVYVLTLTTTGSVSRNWSIEAIGTGACAAVAVTSNLNVSPRPF